MDIIERAYGHNTMKETADQKVNIFLSAEGH